ncbi:hypothetical protein N657DRAFT_320398 [Parathielavia appendiculata]|uniref:Uncharacterized protein n=1 Tax=Parathielavia appendiculata TaxID=2587402 RepID=A0AAN6TQZ2_9PEZI|nr:hypothetical protein N657DRAFT_320398 [Parathielavia appendiculata]
MCEGGGKEVTLSRLFRSLGSCNHDVAVAGWGFWGFSQPGRDPCPSGQVRISLTFTLFNDLGGFAPDWKLLEVITTLTAPWALATVTFDRAVLARTSKMPSLADENSTAFRRAHRGRRLRISMNVSACCRVSELMATSEHVGCRASRRLQWCYSVGHLRGKTDTLCETFDTEATHSPPTKCTPTPKNSSPGIWSISDTVGMLGSMQPKTLLGV